MNYEEKDDFINPGKKEQKELLELYSKPIQSLLNDLDNTDIYIDRYDQIYVKNNGEKISSKCKFNSESDLKEYLKFITIVANADLDEVFVNAISNEGHRYAIGYPPVTKYTQATIRLKRNTSLEMLIDKYKALTIEEWNFLVECIKNKRNIYLTGKTNAGKTTVLREMIKVINDGNSRIGVMEDDPELNEELARGVQMSFKDRKLPIELGVKHCLRSDFDYVIIGEIRHSSTATSVLEAIESGLDGMITSLHSGSGFKAITRLVNLISRDSHFANIETTENMVINCVDVIVYFFIDPITGRRYVKEIGEIIDGKFKMLFSK